MESRDLKEVQNEYILRLVCCQVLFATPALGHVVSVTAQRWRRLAARCSIHFGASCTTCVAPAQNGERSTRGSKANRVLRHQERGGDGRGTMGRTQTYDFHPNLVLMAAEMGKRRIAWPTRSTDYRSFRKLA